LVSIFYVFIAVDLCDSVTCDVNAICVDGVCECVTGFVGNGEVCTRK